MRINRLDLLRYGKFTDKSVTLPKSDKDFHLIVGPNEAGKSTLRNAILDLLFGIETRSRYNFLHAHADMRLGAAIEQGDTALDFIRTKARSKTLQNVTGGALPDGALIPFLGQVDRDFFDQMFGLNHERLVQGGQDILNASNDIGQILFQAAAGVGSLGQVRDQFEAEASSLWAKRKSGDREYYAAAAELEQAEAALKAATVRTKDWQEASSSVHQIGEELEKARQFYRQLEQDRIRLERIRRTAPMLNTLKELEDRQAELGAVVTLPQDASECLTRAERDIAIATQSAQSLEDQRTEIARKIAELHPDASMLGRSADIEALFALRQELRSVDTDIAKREGEVQLLWQEVQECVRQLNWPQEDEEAISKRLPGTLLKSTLGKLIRRHEALVQALGTSVETRHQREEELKTLDLQIEALPQTAVPVALHDALSAARALGDVVTQEKQLDAQIDRLQRDLESANRALSPWNHDPVALQALNPPSQDEITALIKRRNDLEAKETLAAQRVTEHQADMDALKLEISQYQAAHQPVTLADVQQVRGDRDETWKSIKSGGIALQEGASGYERQVAQSDELSDQRHDKAQAETEFQLKLDQLERLRLQLTEQTARHQQSTESLLKFDQAWVEQISAMGLGGMPLLKVNSWNASRDKVLAAAVALAEALSAQGSLLERASQASTTLADVLQSMHAKTETLKLSGLILLADDWVKSATRYQERREALLEQKIGAQSSMADLISRQERAQAAVRDWQVDFQKNLALAHLPESTPVEVAQDALDLIDRMHGQLQKIRDIRVNRIGAMRLALKDFDQQAQALSETLAPDLASESAGQLALALSQRLKEAQSSSQELNRLTIELTDVSSKLFSANEQIASAQASLKPLLQLSTTADFENLRVAISNSDRLRTITSQIELTLNQLTSVGDGLPRDVLESELDATDVGLISVVLTDLQQQIDDVVDKQNAYSGALNAANTILAKIAGQADAAKAEAQRQEALARMTNAVDRFIKVHTAAKLLRWSIERFRESKQGPMLSRASDIFMALTQGAFCKLSVDYESDPLKLSGQRVSGELVEIEGMSEGTRDQLYLALRLAALELHLQKTIALPFIADDLFINYDDGRAKAGLQALAQLSESTQVIFLTHHEHLVPVAQSVFGDGLNVVNLG
ncbi:MAG: hypothetical protein COW02_13790 [Comamonadaceae bacterium CG12_big_fil_rev_8_21_14_0_65_59_15]|nr:MAG: hypothetical protein COW02_13790 [Comamonadaceae bacterium CG12_big_fil_rev_8_21_14_0_65_59_15]